MRTFANVTRFNLTQQPDFMFSYRSLFKSLLPLLTIFTFVGCATEQPENLPRRVDQLIAEDKYERALELIENADTSQTDADLARLREKAHLNYGIYLEYRGPEESSMRDRMTGALQQYIEVLKINRENQKAQSEIKQIMGIYATMPGRSPGEDIIEQLNELGFEY